METTAVSSLVDPSIDKKSKDAESIMDKITIRSLYSEVIAFLNTDQVSFSDERTQSLLLCLDSLCGGLVATALEYLDKSAVLKISCENGRYLFEVSDYVKEQTFLVYDKTNYCQCQNFVDKVLKAQLMIMCEHVLAAFLASALRRTTDLRVSIKTFKRKMQDVIESRGTESLSV